MTTVKHYIIRKMLLKHISVACILLQMYTEGIDRKAAAGIRKELLCSRVVFTLLHCHWNAAVSIESGNVSTVFAWYLAAILNRLGRFPLPGSHDSHSVQSNMLPDV